MELCDLQNRSLLISNTLSLYKLSLTIIKSKIPVVEMVDLELTNNFEDLVLNKFYRIIYFDDEGYRHVKYLILIGHDEHLLHFMNPATNKPESLHKRFIIRYEQKEPRKVGEDQHG